MLLILLSWGDVTLSSQLLKSRHVDVLEALMPMPCHLIAPPVHSEAHWLRELNVEKVQAVHFMLYPHQQQTSGLLDLYHTSVGVYLVDNLIDLPDAHDVGCQQRDEVHPFE
jgi:hypothetical protein